MSLAALLRTTSQWAMRLNLGLRHRFPGGEKQHNSSMPHFDCTAENSLLLIIDVQERFVDAIPSIAADAALANKCAC